MKKNLLILLIGIIVGASGAVLASNYLASEIVYNDTTVESALNELYDRSNAAVYTGSTNITPTESEQILNTNGKRLTSNITVSAIPNTYKNLTSSTTVEPIKLFSGVTAYNSNGELITGTTNPNCVSGIYHHNANTNWNIDFGITPSRFLLSYILSDTNRLVFYDGTNFINFVGYTTSSVQQVVVQAGTLNGTKYSYVMGNSTGHYKNVYDIYYMACK